MPLDGRILAQARLELKKRKREFELRYEQKLLSLYSSSGRIKDLDRELKNTMSELFTAALTHDAERSHLLLDDIRTKNMRLQNERKEELKKLKLPEDYPGSEYICEICRDTGNNGTEICHCLICIYKELQSESLSYLFKLGNESFENFDLSFYEDSCPFGNSISPRRAMEIIFQACKEYANKFGPNSLNLFFNGAPGLGKTFLSACIAGVVAENGYSVVYDTASALFTKFGDAVFSKPEDRDEYRAEVERCMQCDLLIIDDLGTEMKTSFTVSALYDIVNSRLIAKKKTIVSSNLTIAELQHRYSEQIMSRLEGEYQVLTFRGEDIRKKKNAL